MAEGEDQREEKEGQKINMRQLRHLVARYSWEEIVSAVKNNPLMTGRSVNIDDLPPVYEILKNKRQIDGRYVLTLGDRDGLIYGIDMLAKIKGVSDKNRFVLTYITWADWLGQYLDEEIVSVVGEERFVFMCLLEMTTLGTDEYSVLDAIEQFSKTRNVTEGKSALN